LDDLPGEVVEGQTAYKEKSTAVNYKQETTWSPPFQSKILQFPPKQKRDAPKVEGRFKSGQQVIHRAFGDGIVVSSHVRHDVEEVEVIFQGYGTKKIDASFLMPK
jgi:hypothetical protein